MDYKLKTKYIYIIMSTTTKSTSDDINKKQIRGIDLVVKALTKSFPFIKGWDFYRETYTSVLFLSLTINIKELTEYVKGTLEPYWNEKLKTEPYDTYLLGSVISDIPVENDVVKLRQTIEDKARNLYESLPDELAIYNDMSSSLTPTERFSFRLGMTIFNYKQIN